VGGRNSFELIAGRSGELGHVLGPGWGEHPLLLCSPEEEGGKGSGMGWLRWHNPGIHGQRLQPLTVP